MISVGIVLCGCAMLHNIVVWQRVRHASLRFWRTNDWKLTRYRRAAQGLIVQFGLNAAGSVGHWKTSGCGQRKDHVAYSNASSHFRFECSEWQCQLEQPHARAFNPGLKNSKQKQSNNQHIQLYSLFSNSYSKWSSVEKTCFRAIWFYIMTWKPSQTLTRKCRNYYFRSTFLIIPIIVNARLCHGTKHTWKFFKNPSWSYYCQMHTKIADCLDTLRRLHPFRVLII